MAGSLETNKNCEDLCKTSGDDGELVGDVEVDADSVLTSFSRCGGCLPSLSWRGTSGTRTSTAS